MLNPRSVSLSIPALKEGEPWRVRVSHRPSGITCEGTSAVSYDIARASAQDNLEREVAVWQAAEDLKSKPGTLTDIDMAARAAGPYGRHG